MSLLVEKLKMRVGGFQLEVDRLELVRGELTCLMGKSGSGKSTLLNGIAGFLPLETGSVRLDGLSLEALPPERRRLALVFQRGTLFSFLTVFGNIEFSLKLQKIPVNERSDRVELWLHRLDIAELSARYPHQLSEGQAQRVALARALITGFPVLLLDEPFSALDVETRGQLRAVLKTLVQEAKVAALMVTHHPEDALAIADKLALIDQGALVWSGSPKEIPANHARIRKLLGESSRDKA